MLPLKRSLLTSEKGFTLLEVMITVLLIIMVTGSISFSYITILKAMDEQSARATTRAGINIALESVVVDLRHAFQVSFEDKSKSIRYQVDESGTKVSYIYYWQGQDGSCPSNSFDSTLIYELKRATLSGGINGTFTCGAGDSIIKNLVSPPTSSIAASGALLTFDLTAKVKTSQLRVGAAVTARNLL